MAWRKYFSDSVGFQSAPETTPSTISACACDRSIASALLAASLAIAKHTHRVERVSQARPSLGAIRIHLGGLAEKISCLNGMLIGQCVGPSEIEVCDLRLHGVRTG